MWAIKAAPVAALSLVAVRRRAYGLATGLAFSALGDALLGYSPGLFVAGLVAFLVAHIVYAATFARMWRNPRIGVGAIAVVLYSVCLGAWLIPAAGPLALPVAVYVLAITAMVVSAITARFPNPWVAIGSVLFLISDSVLAVNRFRFPVPFEAWIVLSTYYAGQLLIASGYFRARSAKAG